MNGWNFIVAVAGVVFAAGVSAYLLLLPERRRWVEVVAGVAGVIVALAGAVALLT